MEKLRAKHGILARSIAQSRRLKRLDRAQGFLSESHLNYRAGTFVDRKFMDSVKNVNPKYRQSIIEHGKNIIRKTADEIKSHAETIPVSPMFLVSTQEAKCADDCCKPIGVTGKRARTRLRRRHANRQDQFDEADEILEDLARRDDDIRAARRNYEIYHQLPSGCSTVEQVAMSSAGL